MVYLLRGMVSVNTNDREVTEDELQILKDV